MINSIAFIVCCVWIYFLIARAFYLHFFLKTLWKLMNLLTRIENYEFPHLERDKLSSIFSNHFYLSYKHIYRKFKYGDSNYTDWAIKTARWSFLLFPIHLYSIYRINQLIKRIKEDEM